ncbi:MAG: signal peptidase I [Oscillospiraceae bacterium]|nr:signal peptidase I [Oscillospiraceae bacterium]
MEEEIKNNENAQECEELAEHNDNKPTEADNNDDDNNSAKALVNDILDIVESVISSVFVVLLIFTFLFKIATVSGTSMVDTLNDGDKLIISDLFYEPEYGDIVILNQPINGNDYIVKRIIATEGQTVNIVYSDSGIGSVYVDGVLLEEDYIRETMLNGKDMTIKVGEGQVFVMGDNRNHSTDGRFFGPISEEKIVGKVIIRYFPSFKFGL